MRKFLFLSLMFAVRVMADLKDPSVLAATDGDPQVTVSQHVNALTGDFTRFQDDYVVPGIEPISIRRIYVSGDGAGENTWQFFPQTKLFFLTGSYTPRIVVGQPSGSFLTYKFKKHRKPDIYLPDLEKHGKGVTNTAHGVISGRTNFKNSKVVQLRNTLYQLTCADGTERVYKNKKGEGIKKYLLEHERLPNRNQIFYEYDDKLRLTLIKTTNPSASKIYAWARFRYLDQKEPSADFNIETSDGKVLEYRFAKEGNEQIGFHTFLKSVNPPEKPKEIFEYSKTGNFMKKIFFPEGREILADYYKGGKNTVLGRDVKLNPNDSRNGRVKILYEQVGPNNEQIGASYFFYSIPREEKHGEYFYKEGTTEVVDAMGCKTIFRFTPSFYPTSIESYDERGQHHHSVQMTWNHIGEIQRKTLLDADRKEVWTREFFYDEKGNVIEERFSGDLCGRGQRETYSKRIKYTPNHLPTRIEEDNGSVTLFSYLAGTPFITAQLQCEGEKILKREFHEYDADNLLVRTISDDGNSSEKENLTAVTYRKITQIQRKQAAPALGFPEVIEQRYLDLASSTEVLLSRQTFTYQGDGKLSRRDIYDAEGNFCYSLHTSYDSMGRPCEESNPLGQIQKTRYDVFGNPTYQESFSGQLTTELVYDKANRLSHAKEVGRDGLIHINQFSYDVKSRKTAAIDHFGNITHFKLNPIGSSLETHLPEAAPWKMQTTSNFDGLGREIVKIDERGDATRFSYNAYGKPTRILYADGSAEQFFYDKNGALAEKLDQRGSITAFTYDVFGREVEKRIYDEKRALLIQETSKYKGDLLVQHVDAVGHEMRYLYDFAGRQIAQENEFQRIEYAYDALGRKRKTLTSDGNHTLHSIKEYDFLERVLEERCEDDSGQVLKRVLYDYDAAGNKSCITRFMSGRESQERFFYDAFNRLIAQVDASGNKTTIEQDETYRNAQTQQVLKKITTDARGMHTYETFDSLGRVVRTESRSSKGELVSFEKFFYDAGGKLCKQDGELVTQGTPHSVVTTLWEYGVMGRLLSLTEAAHKPEQRITRYTYDAAGLLHEIIKPNGIVLTHKYDVLGRRIRLSSSQPSIDYSYTYDALGRMIGIRNEYTQQATSREYDKRGCLIAETLETGVPMTYSYDPLGRRTNLQFINKSGVAYKYDALFLREVTRLAKDSTISYEHRYLTYDEAGNLLDEQLPYTLGMQTRDIDIQGRTVALDSPHAHFAITAFDPTGNILQTRTSQEERAFAYDDLSQLVSEKEHSYVYDSHNNRVQQDRDAHTLNALNELVKTPNATFTYDACGNPLTQQTAERTINYKYDALDRLIEVLFPYQMGLLFTYDGMHRRLTKEKYVWDGSAWQRESLVFYMYDDQNEIGMLNPKGEIKQLRILGRASRAEAGAAIAIELDDTVYIPQHDLFGNVASLISPISNAKVESYDYTAFGQEILPAHAQSALKNTWKNPWRYQSKRIDEETGLVLYGRRYYMPSLGRWLTNDPKGHTALSSLYAFCSNNPLTHFDLYGLEDLVEEERNMPQSESSFFSKVGSFVSSCARDVASFFSEWSNNYTIDAPMSENCGIGYINGINTTYAEAREHALMLSGFSGTSINLTHSASHGIQNDLPCCVWEYIGGVTLGKSLLQKNWDKFLDTAPEEAKYLQICTSGGCIELYNALESSPPEVRNRIKVLAIAPGKIIPTNLCYQSENFMSKRDIVPRLDLFGQVRYRGQLIILEPHDDADSFDHSIMSPTFRPIIRSRIASHIENNRGKK